ncbi:sigma-54 interaction domain-containing protein [Simplicispira psychrophila]|uniref:sigma-54 interaction domain-containing protein n=1 Tax=Simplicispira psychrophila TaxID=80882 RepID=UPI003CCB9A55
MLTNLSVLAPPNTPAEFQSCHDNLAQDGRFGYLVGCSEPMQRVYQQISRVAATSVTVFIGGESGTGKELVAQTVHDLSRRREQAFLAVNCGAISPQLMESEIFGHEKGSFTGADRQHQGLFERAHGGTLFLDEVTEMPMELQVKLLRVLETGSFMRVGSSVARSTDVRIIAATNRDPLAAVQAGALREDLLYRLNVFPIALPPLRARPQDIALLSAHFLSDIGEREGALRQLTPSALQRLEAYRWPGNVRELRNVLQRAYIMAEDALITEEWLPTDAPETEAGVNRKNGPGDALNFQLGSSLADVEQQLILWTLSRFDNHKERTAAALGVSLKTLYNKLKSYQKATAIPSPSPLPLHPEQSSM